MASTAAYLARRAAQKERVRILYRRALKDTLNWAVHRHLFYDDASNLRERFEENRHVVRFPLFTSLPFQIIASLTWFRSTHPLSYFVP
uniref:NADH dehydrogenase [ubiquinone] 1 beta subcomplex subunit 9 n=1 Tax=Glycine max TaxID=3847 RepID=I1JSJ0_SOYBN